MTPKLATLALAAVLTLSACGSDDGSESATTTAAAPTTEAPATTAAPATTTTTSPTSTEVTQNQTGTGQIAIHFEEVQGVFIEGFEAGIRIETGSGDVIYSTLWTDFVSRIEDATVVDFYNSVLTETVPVGEVVVLATVNVGMGPAPVRPDLNGEMACKLVLEVPADATVEIEVAFNGSENCLIVTGIS